MYPKLNINLENKTSYSNTGNFFSKSLIIKENIEQFKKIALIVDSEKSLNQYIKVFDYLKINYEEINSYSSLCNLSHNNSGVFFVLNYTLKEEIIKESQLIHFSQIIEKGSSQDINNIVKKLSELGYDFSDFQNKGTYKKSGDILSITDFSGNTEYKISFWGENIEEIIEIRKNKNNIISTEEIKKVTLGGSKNIFNDDEKKEGNIQNYLKTSKIFTILDSLDFSEFYEENTKILHNFCSFDFVGNKELKTKNLEIENPVIENIENLKEILRPHSFSPNGSYVDIIIYTKNKKTITNFIDYNNLNKDVVIKEIFGNFLKSFKINNKVRDDELSTLQVISDDILGKIFIKKRINKNISADIDLLLKINIGDFVVHIDHGIGIFKGIIKKELPTSNNGKIIIKEYIEIDYKGEDKLFVPITEVSRVNKYIGLENPKLTGLNTTEWIKKLSKVNQEVEDIAQELLEIYSQRQLGKSFSFLPNLKKETDFKASFTYIYTVDQEQVISEILGDMEKQQPMDRLLVGDVGFGKTEVAFNAIYRSFLNKKQSILIAPLVVLAYEHYEKAVDRFKQFGMNIAVITRMESVKKIDEVLKKLNSGEIDLVVGTHKLLSDKINYKDLGLLVVDEEHKFGVKDKEKIKKLKSTIDILSMSATPIPRSLNMALSQIKQMSIIKTPPQGRKDINTIISKFSERVILDGCTSEFKRGGQVYFVHNRVNTLIHFEKVLQGLFPDKKIITTHGQLPGNTLEKRILDFKHKKYDILLTTTVIENGIDFPNVNTIFINDAPIFGISQIHQLRGRVGRSDRLGHCYLLYKKENLGEETAKRLKTIVNFSYLGAGFELAMKDLEIRGGGDLLGSKQSGQSSEIGVNLYLKMIEEKINELKIASHHSVSPKGREAVYGSKINTKIDLQSNIGIPDSYFDSDLDKINFYREIESINNLDDLDELIEDFKQENNVDVFPEEMQNFFDLLKVKLYSNKFNIEHIKKVGINYQIDFNSTTTISKIREFLSLDKQIKFVVITPQRLRCRVKDFTNTEKFLKYLLDIFKGNIGKKRIKLKK